MFSAILNTITKRVCIIENLILNRNKDMHCSVCLGKQINKEVLTTTKLACGSRVAVFSYDTNK